MESFVQNKALQLLLLLLLCTSESLWCCSHLKEAPDTAGSSEQPQPPELAFQLWSDCSPLEPPAFFLYLEGIKAHKVLSVSPVLRAGAGLAGQFWCWIWVLC